MKKSAKKTAKGYVNDDFNRLPIVLSLFISFVILALSLVALLGTQRNLVDQAGAEQLKVLQNNKK